MDMNTYHDHNLRAGEVNVLRVLKRSRSPPPGANTVELTRWRTEFLYAIELA